MSFEEIRRTVKKYAVLNTVIGLVFCILICLLLFRSIHTGKNNTYSLNYKDLVAVGIPITLNLFQMILAIHHLYAGNRSVNCFNRFFMADGMSRGAIICLIPEMAVVFIMGNTFGAERLVYKANCFFGICYFFRIIIIYKLYSQVKRMSFTINHQIPVEWEVHWRNNSNLELLQEENGSILVDTSLEIPPFPKSEPTISTNIQSEEIEMEVKSRIDLGFEMIPLDSPVVKETDV